MAERVMFILCDKIKSCFLILHSCYYEVLVFVFGVCLLYCPMDGSVSIEYCFFRLRCMNECVVPSVTLPFVSLAVVYPLTGGWHLRIHSSLVLD